MFVLREMQLKVLTSFTNGGCLRIDTTFKQLFIGSFVRDDEALTKTRFSDNHLNKALSTTMEVLVVTPSNPTCIQMKKKHIKYGILLNQFYSIKLSVNAHG